jgi:hypothetical protein
LLIITGCTASHAQHIAIAVPARLTSFNGCAEALAALRKATEASVGPNGLASSGSGYAGSGSSAGRSPVESAPAEAPANAAAGAAAGSSAAAPAHSGTNDYVPGVDEPDLVKTDGRRIVTVTGNVLRVVDAATHMVTGSLDLAAAGLRYQPVNLLLSGDHALLLGTAQGGVPQLPAYGSRLALVDLSGQPRLLSSYGIDGNLVDARMLGSVTRVVVGSQPRLNFPYPAEETDAQRAAANRAVIGQASLNAWLPQFAESGNGTTITGQVPCTSVSTPVSYSGANLLTVLTFDLSSSTLGSGNGVTIVADGDTVYGTSSSLYVASGDIYRPNQMSGAGSVRQQTGIYRFDISQPGPPRYVAAGSVPGYLVDQYAMSEWNGYLRVATTTGTSWALADGRPADARTSSSGVYVLSTSGPAMQTVGQVTGLGTTERIYSVRYEGPNGYVVTFRQTDPLYTLDLSDPVRPRVVGSLALTGYSSYLDPVSTTQLIGIGQQADAMGRMGGTQVSLFDVSDLAAPTRLATYALAGAHSDAEFDPHAFLYWPESHLVVVPIQLPYGLDQPGTGSGSAAPGGSGGFAPSSSQSQAGALVLRINGASINEAGYISQPGSGSTYGYSPIERSMVIGQTLWTVSGGGLMASDLGTLREQAWIPFT